MKASIESSPTAMLMAVTTPTFRRSFRVTVGNIAAEGRTQSRRVFHVWDRSWVVEHVPPCASALRQRTACSCIFHLPPHQNILDDDDTCYCSSEDVTDGCEPPPASSFGALPDPHAFPLPRLKPLFFHHSEAPSL